MRAHLQRVLYASVHVEDREVSSIGKGILILLGVGKEDGESQLEAMAKKVAGLRIFDDDQGRMNRSNEDVGGEYLVVSQFTLYADLTRGKRPSFDGSMKPPESEQLYERFCARLGELTGRPVKQGRFGAAMVVSLRNDGPATFLIEL